MSVIVICCFIWDELYRGVEDYSFYYKLDIADSIFSLLIFPFVYLYFWSLTHRGKATWKQYLWFLPAILFGGISTVFYLLMGEEQSTDFIQKMVESRETYPFEPGSLQWTFAFIGWDVFYFIILLQVIVIMTYSTLNVIRYRRGLENFFSNLNEKSIENNRAVLIGLYILLFLSLIIFISRIISPDKDFSVRYFFMMATGITIYYMSYQVFKTKYSADDIIPEMEKETNEYINPAELDDVYAKILPQFVLLIEEEKVFLQPNLSLDDIARRINSNRTYISRLINEKFECNFYEFINQKRIEYAQSLILQNPNFTRDEIASESGFLHAPNFSRTFKKQTGITFSEWHKRHT
ncbi:helix-turn-helix domain-containing protein [Bacteroidales bacterium OttesenSCG-928-A17]|nr:helix-turn-helix domain-containing protein [Bacteroidales bacterium OttesenSCG-928-A17]